VSAFGDILQRMVERVPGALGAVFADWEGEAVDQFAAEEAPQEIRLVGAHWGVVLNVTAERVRLMRGGEVDELWVEADHGLVLIRAVAGGYYVVLSTGPETHLATARRALDVSVTELRSEM